MSRYKVVVTDDRYKDYEVEKKVLEDIDAEVMVFDCHTQDEVIETCRDADGILVNLAPMGKEVIDSLEKCRVIARYGVGYDNVDVDACTAKNIQVANVTDYCMEEVSDQALALLMSCVRRTARRDAQVRAGMWNIGQKEPVHRMAGSVFGFMGFGMIGRTLLRKIKGMDLSAILVYDPYLDAETIEGYGCRKAEWDELLKASDYISIHMPLNDETKGMIDQAAFDMMKGNAIVINTSRGPVIDEDVLIDSLKNNIIGGAGLDVHCSEPLEEDNELKKLGNCVLSDHTGWYSEESITELKRKAAENIRDYLNLGKVKYPVNKI